MPLPRLIAHGGGMGMCESWDSKELTMTEFFNNPIAVGMSIFGLLLLVGSGFAKWQSCWERKHQQKNDGR